VNAVLHAGNLGELDAIADLAVSLGALNLRLFPIAALGRGIEIQVEDLGVAHWMTILERLPDLRRRTGLDIVAMGPVLRTASGPAAPRPGARISPRLIAGPDGEIFPCPPLRETSLGRVADILTVKDWASVTARAAALMTACATCELLALCVGIDPVTPFEPGGRRYGHPRGRHHLVLAS
jgi:radical SAM protein with 4Fe4S-binding SPASM domain